MPQGKHFGILKNSENFPQKDTNRLKEMLGKRQEKQGNRLSYQNIPQWRKHIFNKAKTFKLEQTNTVTIVTNQQTKRLKFRLQNHDQHKVKHQSKATCL